jgi:phage gpG-like protein
MGVVETFIKRLDEMKASINTSIQTSINKNKDVLIEQQTEGQMDKGKDANNISFVPKYAKSTRDYKKLKGQPTDRVTLKDTGKLYDSIEIQANTTQAVISTNVNYFQFLVAHYINNQILGINEEGTKLFLDKYTIPEIEKNFKAIIKK